MNEYERDLLNEELEIKVKGLHQEIGGHVTAIFNEENKDNPDLELIKKNKEEMRLLNLQINALKK